MTHATEMGSHPCQICKKPHLRFVEGFETLPRVTSDYRPFGPGGKLTVCMHCAAVQKITDAQWLNEIGQIYSDYQANRLADGEEQLVMDPVTGQPKKRSLVLMQQLRDQFDFQETSRVLDIGCGDGVTLKAMSEIFPKWLLNGHELGSAKLSRLEKISGFQRLYTGDLSEIDQAFDFIMMMHSLEHFVKPLNTLDIIRKQINEKSRLFVQVCNTDENPFDLLIADHLMHFSPTSLTNIAGQAGFECLTIQTSWVKKELSFLGSAENQVFPLKEVDPESVFNKITAHVAWLSELINDARTKAASTDSFGIFGTAVAASWLATELGDQVQFFVDEDPHRIGRHYMNKPVYAPKDVPTKSSVYLALAPSLASGIAARLQNSLWSFVKAPALHTG